MDYPNGTNNGEKWRLQTVIEAREKFLLYGLSIIVAMLGWFSLTVYQKLDAVALRQAERTRTIEQMNHVVENMRQLEQSQYQISINKAWIEDIKRRLDYLERYTYGTKPSGKE